MSASSSIEKKVYFRVEKYPERCPGKRRGLYEWYAIDDNHNNSSNEEEQQEVVVKGTPPDDDDDDDDENEKDLETLDPVFESPPDYSYFLSGTAAWKSYIYIMGGSEWLPRYGLTSVSNVYFIDTLDPQLGWQPGPDLKTVRRCTRGVVLNGKICVLGGYPDASPYGETLSSVQNWSPMSINDEGAPMTIYGHAIFSDKLFAYGCSGALHCYDFKDNKWSVIEKDFRRWEYQCASIDGIMYLVEGGKFMGFDLQTYNWYEVVGLNKDSMLPRFSDEGEYWGFISSLVHIGNGTLCLLWNYFLSLEYSAIHCTKFTVSKEFDHTLGCHIIKAHVKSYKRYRINGGFLAADALVVGEDSDPDKEEEWSANCERKLQNKKKKNKNKKKKNQKKRS